MNKNTTNIKKELDQTNNRLNELREMRLQINGSLQTLQQGFIDGKTSLDALQTEQGKLTTLDSSINALEDKQSELQANFDEAEKQEKRQALLKKAKETAIEAESFHNEYQKMRNDFHNSIRDYAEKLIDELIAYRGKQKEFQQISDQTQLTFKELEQLGLSAESHKIAAADYINYQPFEYGEVVALAENLRRVKLDREAQAEYRAEFDEERAANQERIKAQIEAESNQPETALITYSRQ